MRHSIFKIKNIEFIIFIAVLSLLKCLLLYWLTETVVAPGRNIGYTPDSIIYHRLAENIISGRGFSFETEAPFRPTMSKEPLYSFFIALVYLVFKPVVNNVVILQILLNPFIAILTYFIGQQLLEERLARFAALLVCLTPVFGDISYFVMPDAIFIPLLLLLVYILIKAFNENKLNYYIFSGGLLGLCALCRNIVFCLPVFVILLIIFGYGKGLQFNKVSFKARFINAAVLFLSFLIIASPWALRNMQKFKSFQISQRGGRMLLAQATMAENFSDKELKAYFLYLISGKLAQKKFPEFIGNDIAKFEFQFYNRISPEQLKKKGFTEGQIDLIFMKEAIKKIFLHPFKFIRISTICYIQVFKYFIPWSILMSKGDTPILSNFIFPALRFLFGIFLGLPYTLMFILGVYFTKKNIIKYLPVLMFIVYFHFMSYFFCHAAGSILRYILPIVPVYSFFVSAFIFYIIKMEEN